MNRALQLSVICLIIISLSQYSAAQTTSKCPEIIATELPADHLDQHSIAAMARCHVQMLDNLQAARWFEKIADLEECQPDYLLEYGQCLKSLKLYGKAKFYFQKYAQHNPVEGHQFMQSCDIAKMMLEGEQLFNVTALSSNTLSSEYATGLVQGNICFNSWAPSASAPILSLVSAQGDAPQQFISGISTTQTISNMRISANGEYAVFCSNGFQAGQRILPVSRGNMIYLAEMLPSGKWSEPVLIPFGNADWTTGFPTLSENGNVMFFASTMPGGLGGWDIYVSRRSGETWSKPENLGSEINTPGNEISPFVGESRLYFSSDWHIGIGGFDVFVATIDGRTFGNVRNMGFPVNSPKDDLDLIWDATTDCAYFSSNRIGGVGLYDLYKAVPQFREIEVSVVHKESMKPVDNVVLTISPGTSMAYFTNAKGSAMLYQPLTGEREILAKKDGYKEQKLKLITGTNASNSYQVYLEPVKTSISQPGEVRIVQEVKPEKNAAEVVKTTTVEKQAAPVVSAMPVRMKDMYFIQIAALARHASLESYEDLKAYGDLILHDDGTYAKVRLGTFATESEAKLVLSRIKTEGYKDAFVVKQAVSSDAQTQSHTFSGSSHYKVRLATYAKAGSFNPELVTHLGSIESYRQDQLTIMFLAGYSSLSAAQKARDAAASKGFTDAYVVMDNGGVYERVR